MSVPPNRLEELRRKAQLTQTQVADRLGISQRRVSYHEQGMIELDALAIQGYAKVYKVKPVALFIDTECASRAADVQ